MVIEIYCFACLNFRILLFSIQVDFLLAPEILTKLKTTYKSLAEILWCTSLQFYFQDQHRISYNAASYKILLRSDLKILQIFFNNFIKILLLDILQLFISPLWNLHLFLYGSNPSWYWFLIIHLIFWINVLPLLITNFFKNWFSQWN